MKKTSLIYIALFSLLTLAQSACENEDLNPYLEPLPGVHAYAEIPADQPANFVYGQLSEAVPFDIEWVSVDGKLEVNKVELYLLFNENFKDADDNPKVARHGGSEGILFKTFEGDQVPGNREVFNFSVTQNEMYALYKDATYDYNGNGTATPVFNNPDEPMRNTTTSPFTTDDDFTVRWVLYTTSGLMFDSWSPSVCTELPGANCEVTWSVEMP